MQPQAKTIIDLEKKFWQSMVDNETDVALGMLAEPSLMVSSHGAMTFDHDKYRQMAEKGTMVLKSYELSDMQVIFPNENTAVATYHVKQTMAPRGNGDGACFAKCASSSSTPKFEMAEPKNTGVCLPAR